jgi:excisionase family DNA binding protein
MDTNNSLLTLDEMAKFIGLGRRTVYRLASAKQIPAFKVGGQWRFDPPTIREWISKQMLRSSEPANPNPPRMLSEECPLDSQPKAETENLSAQPPCGTEGYPATAEYDANDSMNKAG